MTKLVRSFAIILAAFWIGIVFCIGFIVAPYLFALAAQKSPAVPNTGAAATLIGPLISGTHLLGVVVGTVLILGLTYLRRQDDVPLGDRLYLSELGLGVAVACAAANLWVITPRLKAIQEQLVERFGAFHQADKADPLYQQFGALHQASTILFIVGFVAALVALLCMTQFRPRTPRREIRTA
jgi:hypothetical protein